MTRRRMLAAMDSVELSEWMAYFRLEGEDRQRRDLAAAAHGNVRRR